MQLGCLVLPDTEIQAEHLRWTDSEKSMGHTRNGAGQQNTRSLPQTIHRLKFPVAERFKFEK